MTGYQWAADGEAYMRHEEGRARQESWNAQVERFGEYQDPPARDLVAEAHDLALLADQNRTWTAEYMARGEAHYDWRAV